MTEPVVPNETPANLSRSIRFLFWGMMTSVIILSIVVVVVHYTTEPATIPAQVRQILTGLTALAGLVGVLISTSSYKKGIILAKNLTGSLNDKLVAYRSLLIRCLAISEAPALFSLIAFLVTGEWISLLVGLVLAISMLRMAPTRKRMIEELGLDWSDQEKL